MRPFDLKATYLHLAGDNAAERIEIDERFWPDVMAGKRLLPGRLVCAFRLTEETAWEMHPAGEELLYLLSGAAEVIAGDARVRLDETARGFLVPRGAWHRILPRPEAEILFVTPGEGTEHREAD